MALQTTRTDDITGEPGAETVVITVNGQGIEIDLADKSMDRLVKALEPFWKVGSPSDYVVTRPMRNTTRKKAPTNDRGYDLQELRAWADRTGVQLPQRGRIPQHIVDQFLRS